MARNRCGSGVSGPLRVIDDPGTSEDASYRLVLLYCDARPSGNDRVSLPYGPLVPAAERLVEAVAQRGWDRLKRCPG